MRIEQALDFLHASNAAQFESLSDLLPPELIIALPGQHPFVAPSAFVQARKKLRDKSIARLFHQTAACQYQQANHPGWAGLQLLAVDGVMQHPPIPRTMPTPSPSPKPSRGRVAELEKQAGCLYCRPEGSEVTPAA